MEYARPLTGIDALAFEGPAAAQDRAAGQDANIREKFRTASAEKKTHTGEPWNGWRSGLPPTSSRSSW